MKIRHWMLKFYKRITKTRRGLESRQREYIEKVQQIKERVEPLAKRGYEEVKQLRNPEYVREKYSDLKEEAFSYKFEREQMQYLSQSIKLEEASDPHVIRYTILLISASVFLFIIWSGITSVSEVAKAEGEVVPDGFVRLIQHREGGIVREISARDGQLIQKGEVILVLEDGKVKQELAKARIRDLSLRLQQERISAFVEERDPEFSITKEKSKELLEKQNRLFRSMSEAKEKERKVLQEQITQKEKSLRGLRVRRESLKRRLSISKEMMQIQKKLLKKGHTSKVVFLQHKREVNDVEGQLNQVRADVSNALGVIREFKGRLDSLDARFKDEALLQLEQLESSIAENSEALVRFEEKARRLKIKSPIRGLVKGLKINTIGAVVNPGDSILEIVPIDETLVVEAKISPKDIGHVSVDQSVRVKVSTFDFARYGAVEGKLKSVSATTFVSPEGEPYYKGLVELEKNYVGQNANLNLILPGMTVEAEIITGRKTILAYLMKPIHRSIASSLSER